MTEIGVLVVMGRGERWCYGVQRRHRVTRIRAGDRLRWAELAGCVLERGPSFGACGPRDWVVRDELGYEHPLEIHLGSTVTLSDGPVGREEAPWLSPGRADVRWPPVVGGRIDEVA